MSKCRVFHIGVTRVTDGVSLASFATDKKRSDQNNCEAIIGESFNEAKTHNRLKEGSFSYIYETSAEKVVVGVYRDKERDSSPCIYTVITGEGSPAKWVQGLVEKVAKEFKTEYKHDIDSASVNKHSRSFERHVTKKLIKDAEKDADFFEITNKNKKLLDETREITLENISQQLERSQNIDEVESKSDDLLTFSTQFRKDSKEAKCKALRNCILMYALGIIIVAIIIIVILAVMGVFDDKKSD